MAASAAAIYKYPNAVILHDAAAPTQGRRTRAVRASDSLPSSSIDPAGGNSKRPPKNPTTQCLQRAETSQVLNCFLCRIRQSASAIHRAERQCRQCCLVVHVPSP
ncbi:hypothetical protein X797_001809 [Metarhizium robertsii]|uniref:Uncharacterized protein n=1 Tax=Metarhizium robertsii TaxID=568076 RepID=A0A0A1V1H0_9HYPO|nr:hypothetical protein X797_001809 [Metarhizium robertsii]